jgi:hypothetical protein
MKTNAKHEVVGRIIQKGLVAGTLFALPLFGAGVTRAQSAATPAPSVSAKPASSSTIHTQAAVTAGVPPAIPQTANGSHVGVTVHGHWIIDVKNPDGTLASHAEFENALCPTTGGGISNGGVAGGDALIASLLGGFVVVGGWQIQLGNPVVPSGPAPGPACGNGVVPSLLYVLEQNNDGQSLSGNCQSAVGCFPGLNPPQLTSSANVLTLSGQFTVPTGASSTKITAVGTSVSACLLALGNTAASCLAIPGNTLSQLGSYQLTGAYLTGVAPLPAAPTVTASQSVAVTVTLSFQ